MNDPKIVRAFQKANKGKGLSADVLRQFLDAGSHDAQAALDFILPLLERNDKDTVAIVVKAAQRAYRGHDGIDGVVEVFAKANAPGFPRSESTVGNSYVLEACLIACEHYDPTPEPTEAQVPALK